MTLKHHGCFEIHVATRKEIVAVVKSVIALKIYINSV